MPVYLVISYDITDPEKFTEYPGRVMPLLQKHGARLLASDTDGKAVEGHPKMMNALIEFPSEEAVWNCYNDAAYAAVKNIRLSTTENCTMVIVKQFSNNPGFS